MTSGNKAQVYIASDHAGFELKERLIKLRPELAWVTWVDLGPSDATRVDYPDYADRVAHGVRTSPEARGVLICGSGQGMAMRANRHPGVRAALAWNEDSARLSREHNNANILCLGARLLTEDLAARLIEVFLTTKFEGGRHQDRVEKIERPTEC